VLAPSELIAAVAQWDFDGNLASSTGGSNLVLGAAGPAISPGLSFTTTTINGQPAQVAAFTRGTYFRVTHGLAANGGGNLLNNYTLIMDVMFPSRPTGWAALWQTSSANSDDGEWFINPNRGLGISGNYGGDVPDGTWNRLALVVDTTQGTFTSYLNGTQVQQNTGLSLDGRWAVLSQALLFADENQENAAGFVNSVQLQDRALTATDIAELGGPSAAGIPIASTPALQSGPPPNPLFGQPLQLNGGFESLFTNWLTIAGHPVALTSAYSKGSPHSGTRFFHGGLNPAGDSIVRQEIDLLAAGFDPKEIDDGAALDAEAWLRNWFGAGTFDDQVFYRVAYLNGADEELSSMRCLIAANNAWLQRTLAGLLPPGTRKLRIEIVGKHRRDLDNDSMADDIVVRLQPITTSVTPNITKLPMLQDVRPNAMTLLWETDGNLAAHAVEWGQTNIAEHTLSRVESLKIDNTHYVHRATLTGLDTETAYVYRVRSGTNATAAFSFRTAPKHDTPFAVAWWGDNHQGTTTLRTHVSNMLDHLPDMICVAGDMVNSGNAISEWHNYWFKPLEHLNCGQTRPVIFARGNHDGEHALAYAYSALPGNEAWFAFDYGNSRFIFLDSEIDTSGSPEQFAWLQSELSRPETQRAAFRIVCFHRPPWVNLWNGGGTTGETWVRNDWVPLFSQKNVDLVICGHAHNYNRGASNGVTYVVSGGGGGTLDVERVAFWPLYTVEYSRYHFDLMEVNGNMLTWQTFDNNNQLIDFFTLNSRVPTLSLIPANSKEEVMNVVLSGKPGVRYYIQSSTDLTSWTNVATNTLPASGPLMATNAVPSIDGRYFFRAQIAP
jgi:3',5'-cyclic AMP phosphodiesterase CpdA